MWKMLDLDFPWSRTGDITKQRERGPKLWGAQPSITPSGQIAAEAVQQALWPGHNQEDQKEESPRGPGPAAGEARRIQAEGPGKLEREGREKRGEEGRKLRVNSQDDLSHTLTPPFAFLQWILLRAKENMTTKYSECIRTRDAVGNVSTPPLLFSLYCEYWFILWLMSCESGCFRLHLANDWKAPHVWKMYVFWEVMAVSYLT